MFTVSQAGSGGSASNLIVNPGFESGHSAWTESSNGGFDIIWNEPSVAHAGSYDAWLGGYVSGSDFIYQKVTIPANAQTANLQFWSKISTDELAGGGMYDYLTVDLYDGATGAYRTNLTTLSNLDAAAGWSLRTVQFDVSAIKGQSVYLGFTATNDDRAISSFQIDDVSLTVSTGSNTLPGAPTIGAATAGNASISVAFTPGAIGSGTLVSYWAACSSNNADYVFGSGASSPITVTGLTNGAAYYCWTLTRSTVGDGAWSAASNSVTPISPTLPDLVVSALTAPSTGVIGSQITMSATVLNQGTATAGASRLGFYFSTDAMITTSDTFSGTSCSMAALAVGGSQACSGSVSIPGSLAPGTYYLGAYADDLLAVGESDGGNNFRTSLISLTASSSINYSDSWWNANESGWGITITDHGSNAFVQWYTYDQLGHNQKYVISGGTFSSDKCQFSGTIGHVTGPSWTSPTFDPTRVTRTTVGSGTINFCPNGLPAGTIVFNYTADGVSGSKQLTRLSFGNDVPHQGGTANTGAADFTDLWYNPSESGWGVSVTQHGNNIFFRIFVYDTDGRPLLFIVPGATFNSASSFTGAVTLTTGPWYASNPFDPNQVVRTTAGTATLTFSDANNGVLSYTVNGVTKTKTITRIAF